MDKQLALTSLSERNYGIVTMVELTALGFSPDQVKRLVRSGRLERRHHRVFRFRGSAITWEQELVAACRWAGERAAATHLSAARLWELDGFRDLSIQITTPERRRAKPGVTLHQRTLRPDEVEIRRGIPVTSVPRTLLDLGSSAHLRRVELALDSAFRRRLVSMQEMHGFLEKTGGRGVRGSRTLRELLAERPGGVLSESALETKMLRLLRRGGLPAPQQQSVLGDRGSFIGRVDFLYPEQKLVIEVDGYRYHQGRQPWLGDMRRQNRLTAEGLRVLRFSEEDIDLRSDDVLATVRRFFRTERADSAR